MLSIHALRTCNSSQSVEGRSLVPGFRLSGSFKIGWRRKNFLHILLLKVKVCRIAFISILVCSTLLGSILLLPKGRNPTGIHLNRFQIFFGFSHICRLSNPLSLMSGHFRHIQIHSNIGNEKNVTIFKAAISVN